MISKKSKKADLERKRFAFFQLGLILAGAICLAAFEYASPVFGIVNLQSSNNDEIVDIYGEIPKEIVVTKKIINKKIQPPINEVEPVKDPPKTVKTIQKKIDLNNKGVEAFLTTLGEGGEGIFDPKPPTDTVDIPQTYPKFPGGELAMARWISENFNVPDYAIPVSGLIVVNFIVDAEGKIVNVTIGKGIEPAHDKAAILAVKKMPRWTPGEQYGKPVAVRYNLPISVVNH